MIRKLKSKRVVAFILLFMSVFIIGMSYSLFIINTDKYNSSEMLIANLNYGINVVEDGESGSIVSNGNAVVVPAGTKAYFYVTISSVNKIDTRYTLAYKTSSSATVEYTDRTPWVAEGYIEGYDSNSTYTRKIRVVVDNTENTAEANVEFGVFGGYTHNTDVTLGNGYKPVKGPYTEIVTTIGDRLVDLIEKNTGCVTENAGSCMYGGGSLNNYFQYPEDEDETKNIWRITGTYNVDNKIVAKVVSDLSGTTTVGNIGTSLNAFYGTLDNVDHVVFKTNKFGCTESGCATSGYQNIGLITTYEYTKIGGVNSYLANSNNFFGINGSGVSNITPGGIEETSSETQSGIRPTVYLNTDLQVTGSGTASDPYRVSHRSDINMIAYKLDNGYTDKTYDWLLQNKVVKEVTCEKGTKAAWNYSNSTVTLSELVVPDYCTINFGDGYTVTLKSSITDGAEITSANPISVGYNGSITFTIKAKEGYKLGSTVTCNGATGTIDPTKTENNITVSGVKNTQTCIVTVENERPSGTLAEWVKKQYNASDSKIRTSFTDIYTETDMFMARDDDGPSYYFTGNPNNWVSFAGYLWRVIRINGNGSVRLLYAGQGTSSVTIGEACWGPETGSEQSHIACLANNPAYLGWKYDVNGTNGRGTTLSGVYTEVSNWYKGNTSSSGKKGLTENDRKYIDTAATYCNDRTTSNGTSFTASSQLVISYASTSRLTSSSPSPTLKCSASGDRFKDGFGLMTADEVVFAGGKFGIGNDATYYAIDKDGKPHTGNWTTMTPYSPSKNTLYYIYTFQIGLYGNGYMTNTILEPKSSVRPVISLKKEVLVTGGDGTGTSPYTVALP